MASPSPLTGSGSEEPFIGTADGAAGFSLHAGVSVKISEIKKLEVIELLREIREEQGLSYLFVAHRLAVVEQVSDRVAVPIPDPEHKRAPFIDLRLTE